MCSSDLVSGIDPRTDIETDRRPIGIRINGFVHRRLGGGFRSARVERDVVP